MSAESRAAALRALERASVKRPDASLISGCCQFYVQKKAEGLNAQQAEVALYRMLKFGDDDSKTPSSAPPPPRAAPAAGAAPATGAAPQPKEDDADAVDEAIEAEVFAAYAAPPLPASLANARVHPGEISESVLLASVAAPSLVDVDPGAALEACANSGALSALQLEGALRAARRHAVVANGVRAGFFLGDGAGPARESHSFSTERRWHDRSIRTQGRASARAASSPGAFWTASRAAAAGTSGSRSAPICGWTRSGTSRRCRATFPSSTAAAASTRYKRRPLAGRRSRTRSSSRPTRRWSRPPRRRSSRASTNWSRGAAAPASTAASSSTKRTVAKLCFEIALHFSSPVVVA